MAQDAAGYVIQGRRNLFLSRYPRWVRHKNRFSKGVQRAYVHPEDFVLQGGDWAAGAKNVIPARYDKMADMTVVTGDAIPYDEFVAQRTGQ